MKDSGFNFDLFKLETYLELIQFFINFDFYLLIKYILAVYVDTKVIDQSKSP